MKRRTFIKSSSAGALVMISPATFMKAFGGVEQSSSLEDAFMNPPDSAKARTWFHWMNGNVTKEGLTLDLEAMKQAGVGGFQIFDVGDGIVEGPVAYHSPEWVEMKEHAAREAERLGLRFEMHNCPGWSSSGGPWITPELSMQYLVWSEAYVTGGRRVRMQLPQPTISQGFYRDAMVLAFPSIKGEEESMRDRIINAVSSNGPVDKSIITDGDNDTSVDIDLPASGDPAYLQLELAEPAEIGAITLFGTPLGVISTGFGGASGTAVLEASDDGSNFIKVADIAISAGGRRGGAFVPSIADFAPVQAKYFRLVSHANGFSVRNIELCSGRIADWTYKNNMNLRGGPGSATIAQNRDTATVSQDNIIDPEKVIDITSSMNSQGALNWQAPEGNWTIIRFGHTPTGITNNAAPDQGQGLECDKFSKAAYDFHFEKMFAELLPALRSMAEKGMVGALVDSYEVGAQNWTANFPEQFQGYRGYDLVKYMPAMTGRIVGSPEMSDKFLFDIRKTCADSVAENYYGHFTSLCTENGFVSYTEPYDAGPFDEMQVGTRVDVPMGEFWIRGRTIENDTRRMKLAASVAHICDNGNQIVGAEAYTGSNTNSKWLECPYMMKAQGDWMYTIGLNQFIFHRYAHQPHPTAVPGMTMGPHGFHFDRTNTWFPKATGWLDYVAKAQNMLRQGRFVADIAFFTGEDEPNRNPLKRELPLEVPAGYDYDTINRETILEQMQVQNGKVVLSNGMSYNVLVMTDEPSATLELLSKIRDLVQQGATVVGPKPTSSPGLADHLNGVEAEIKSIADSVWGNIDGYNVTENSYGRGKVIWGQGLAGILGNMGIEPDFVYTAKNADAAINFIHRRVDGDDVYFVANLRRKPEDLVCSFRVEGRVPEVWDAVTGRMAPARIYELADGRVNMPLRLDYADSAFVVFRSRPSSGQVHSIRSGSEVIAGTQPLPVQERGRYRYVKDSFTVSLWVKPETDMDVPSVGSEVISYIPLFPPRGAVLYGSGHATCGLSVGRNAVVLLENEGDGARAVMVAEMPLEGWTHLALTYDGNVPSLYVNGKLVKRGQRSSWEVHPAINEAYMDEGATYFDGETSAVELSPTPLGEAQLQRQVSAGVPAPGEPPAVDLLGLASARPGVIFWKEGNYTVSDSNGGSTTINVSGLGSPVEITSPWSISFQPERGAPSRITLQKLASLHKHSDEGVKYFSGTATYSNTFNVPAGATDNGRRLFLDLGRVEVLAEVKVNGQDIGLFWKPPYLIDVTDAVKSGENTLEVQVTNLWPNRLIGDENLPAENEYSTGGSNFIGRRVGGITEMPDWFLNGGEKPGERITFSTWQHYFKNDPLLESGLIGPVKLRPALVQDLEA